MDLRNDLHEQGVAVFHLKVQDDVETDGFGLEIDFESVDLKNTVMSGDDLGDLLPDLSRFIISGISGIDANANEEDPVFLGNSVGDPALERIQLIDMISV